MKKEANAKMENSRKFEVMQTLFALFVAKKKKMLVDTRTFSHLQSNGNFSFFSFSSAFTINSNGGCMDAT